MFEISGSTRMTSKDRVLCITGRCLARRLRWNAIPPSLRTTSDVTEIQPWPSNHRNQQREVPEHHAWNDPAYCATLDRLQDLRLRETDVERRIDEQHSRMAERPDSDGRRVRAEAMALGQPEPVAGEIPPDISALYEERRVITLAIEMADRHLAEAEMHASKAICARVRPEYVALVDRVRTAAVGLVEAIEAEEAFARDLSDGGTRFAGISRHNWTGIPSREQVEHYTAEAREYFPELRA